MKIISWLETLNQKLAAGLSWLTLLMVLVQFAIVLLRYVFGLGFVWLQESLLYMFGLLFTLAAASTMASNRHVSVDVFHQKLSARSQQWVKLIGTLLFLLPLCAVIFITSLPYVINSWLVFEGSSDISGIHGIFLFKSAIPILALLLALQGLVQIILCWQNLCGQNLSQK